MGVIYFGTVRTSFKLLQTLSDLKMRGLIIANTVRTRDLKVRSKLR
jgi:hypothetical protein